MDIEQIDPKDAWKRMNDPSNQATYLDVRTVEEYQSGHAKGAYNIPVRMRDDSGEMVLNSKFIEEVGEVFSKDKKLVIGCKMGGRSQIACEILTEGGYQNVSNIQGGFGGKRDPSGEVVLQGWSSLELPMEEGNPEGRAYKAK